MYAIRSYYARRFFEIAGFFMEYVPLGITQLPTDVQDRLPAGLPVKAQNCDCDTSVGLKIDGPGKSFQPQTAGLQCQIFQQSPNHLLFEGAGPLMQFFEAQAMVTDAQHDLRMVEISRKFTQRQTDGQRNNFV